MTSDLVVKNRLIHYCLRFQASYDSTMIPVIIQLNNLTYLDISCEPPGMSPFEIISRVCDLDNLLKNVNALPNLIYLDMSGM